MAIDKNQLKELASDPKQTSASIAEALGVSNLYYEFQKDQSLKQIYDEGRAAARDAEKDAGKQTTGSTKRASSKRSTKGLTTTPPPQR